MTVSIGNQSSETRAVECFYCGAATFGSGHVVCIQCDLDTLFSDLWKDEYGMRPRGHYTNAQKRAYIESRP